MDQITRARENFRKQSEAYHGLLERQKKLREQLIDIQRRLDIIDKELPQQKLWFENSKKLVESYGDEKKADKLKQLEKLKREIEKLSGETIEVPVLDAATANAKQSISISTNALRTLGVPD